MTDKGPIKNMFSEELINILSDRIQTNVKPDKIILFGSYANGLQHEASDIDLFIIKDVKKEKVRDLKLSIKKAIRNIVIKNKIDVDILLDSQKRINQRISLGDLFLKDIIEKGKIIYAK